MIKVFCNNCSAEMPKPGSLQPIIEARITSFGINKTPKVVDVTYCENCTKIITEALKKAKPMIVAK